MRIVYFGTYISEYSRNRTMIAALRSAGVEVMECNQPLWTGIEDRVQMDVKRVDLSLARLKRR